MIQNIDVQFTLVRQAGKGKVAAAEIPDDGVDGILTKHEVKFGVQMMPQEQFDNHLFPFELRDKSV